MTWQSSRMRPGPIIIGDITQHTADGPVDRPDLHAIIADRLARIGIQSPTSVPASNLMEQTPSTLGEVPGFFARLFSWINARNTERVGYRVDATLRRSDRVDGYGLTFTAVNRASGRRLHAETMWGASPEEAARRTAFRMGAIIAGLRASPRTRRAPSWTPSSESLRHYENASYFIGNGRFDEAYLSCQEGLEDDPASLPLRYLLGTLHERFGHHKGAVETYASAINILIYDGYAFSRISDKPALNPDEVKKVRRPGDRRTRRIVSDEATQILWRYAGSLTFGHRWIGRWLDDLRRSDGEVRQAPLGYRREVHQDYADEPASSTMERIEQEEIRARNESAKRLRGFFHVRYQRPLEDTFPILDLCVFGEQRQEPLVTKQEMVRSGGHSIAMPPKLCEQWVNMRDLRPLTGPRTAAHIHGWMAWLFDLGATAAAGDRVPEERKAAWLTYLRSWQFAPAGAPSTSFVPSNEDRATFSYTKLGHSADGDATELADGLAAVPRALGGDKPDLTFNERTTSCSFWFSRQRVAMLAYRIAKDLLEHDNKLDGGEADRLGFMVAQLDLRLFFLCCARDEMKLLAPPGPLSRSEVWARPFLSPQLVRQMAKGVAYRQDERLFELLSVLDRWAVEPVSSEGRTARSGRRLRIALPTRGASRRDLAQARLTEPPGWWTRQAERTRGFFTGEGDWNLWYYQACLHALAIEDPPEYLQLEDPATALDVASQPADDRFKAWMRDNDEHARNAIDALNRAVGTRSVRGKTAIEAGVGDWLLFRDPDLDRLRPHLRFTRWSDGLFETDESNLNLEIADRQLHYWSKGRYERPDRLARLAGETFTIDLFSGPIRSNAVHFADLAAKQNQLDGLTLAHCWELLQREHNAWCQLVGLPRFIGSPQMRVRAWRTVKDVAGGYRDYVVYPNTLSAYRQFRLVPVRSVVRQVNFASAQCAGDLHRVANDRHNARPRGDAPADRSGLSTRSSVDVEHLLRRASQRWWDLLDALDHGEIGPPPKDPEADR